MFHKQRNRIKAAAVSAAVIASALMSPLGISGAEFEIADSSPVITANAASTVTIDDLPSEYKEAADWIWTNRIVAEDSTGSRGQRWNTIFDQIIAGKGTINYVVRWQSYKDVTLEQRQKFETLVSDSINAWNDWLAGYENWPYDHIDVNIVGWAVLDESCILDKQDDEIIYTNLTDYDSSGDTSNGVETIPDKLPNAPSELSRFDHFYDKNYEYPGGLDKRFDMYLWATQGFPSIGGCGGDWGQRLSDDAYINMLDGYGVHVLEHEIGHGFGITDFYGENGASDGPPPSGFPDDGTSIMMAGSSAVITNFDGWLLRYMWTQIKDEEGRFDIEETPIVTTTTTTQSPVTTTTTTTTTTEEKITYPTEQFDSTDALSADITLSGTAYAGINGSVGYYDNSISEWVENSFEGTLDADGKYTFNVEIPEGVTEIQVQIYWSGVWDNDKGTTVDVPAEIADVSMNYSAVTTTVTTTTSSTTTTTVTGTAEAEITETDAYWSFHANGAKRAELIFNAASYAGANGAIGYWDNAKYDPDVENSGWQTAAWDGTFDENGELIISVDLPENIDEVQVQCYWSQVWDNAAGAMVDTDVDLVKVILYYGDDEGETTTTTTTTTTSTSTSTTTTTTSSKSATTTTTSKTTTTTASSTTTTTVTATTQPVSLYGDADNSGKVEIADAVKIMCYVTDKENTQIDAQGLANGDVYQIGDGLSVQDALSIQKYLAQIITELPEV